MGNVHCIPKKEAEYCYIYEGTTVIGLILVVLTLFWILYYREGFGVLDHNKLFNWHPFLMTIGMVFLFSQAILTYRTGRNIAKLPLVWTHALLLFITILIAFFGLVPAFINHSVKEIPHLYSLHSWLGMMTIVFFILNFLVAIWCFVWCCPQNKRILCPLHSRVGASIFVIAVVTAITGITEKSIFSIENYEIDVSERIMCNVIGILFAIYGILILYLVKEMCYKRKEKARVTICSTPERVYYPCGHVYYSRPHPCTNRERY